MDAMKQDSYLVIPELWSKKIAEVFARQIDDDILRHFQGYSPEEIIKFTALRVVELQSKYKHSSKIRKKLKKYIKELSETSRLSYDNLGHALKSGQIGRFDNVRIVNQILYEMKIIKPENFFKLGAD
jgi:predicted phage-related endonuclease